MGAGPWSEITEFPPEENTQEPPKAVVRQTDKLDRKPNTAVMIDLVTPKWWQPWRRTTTVRMWTYQTERWVTIAYFKHPLAALNYAEALAQGLAHDFNLRGAGNE